MVELLHRAWRPLIVAVLLVLTVPAAASGQATRTWISGTGNDANSCSRTAPCRTFATAQGVTANGGIINVLDSSDYGSITVTKPLTLAAEQLTATVDQVAVAFAP